MRLVARSLALVVLLAPVAARASFLSGDALDGFANVLSWIILVLVPVAGLAVFWLVHILPEKVAEQRHHPQKDSIKTLCILSLFFGGMLWPFAWIWAYTKPVLYRHAYGSDKHEDYYLELGEMARVGRLPPSEFAHLREELDGMADRGTLSAPLKTLRADLEALAVAPPGGKA